MAARCQRHPVDDSARPSTAVACCRVAGHDGECHGHFSGLIHRSIPHHTWMRANGYAVLCTEGRDLDDPQTPG